MTRSISVVFPIYNEDENILPLLNKTFPVVSSLTKDFEIVFVDDGSADKTSELLSQLAKKDKRIRVYTLAQNMGKATALYVGFQKAQKDIIVTMDSDLQDDPADMPTLVKKIEEGYVFVNGWKKTKHFEHKGSLRRFFSLFFNRLTSLVTGVSLHDFNCPFKAYKNFVAKRLFLYGEMHRYIPVQIASMGCRYTEVGVANYPRKYGKTKYRSSRILRGFFDLITIKYLLSYRNRPLHVFGTIGLAIGSIGFIFDMYLLFIWLAGYGIGGRPLLMLAVLLTVLGLQFISLGLIGEMITNNSIRDPDSLLR